MEFDQKSYAAEAAERWPTTFEVSRRQTAGYDRDDWRQAANDGEEIASRLAELMRAGTGAESVAAMDLAEEHRLSIDRWYYPCAVEQHVGLAEMYLADPRFRQYWEDRARGLAIWVFDAIKANAARAIGAAADDSGAG